MTPLLAAIGNADPSQGAALRLQTNAGRRNHKRLLAELIAQSERSVLCSGWLKHAGLALLLPALRSATSRGAEVLVYSNSQHTEPDAVRALQALGGVTHVIAGEESRYLHTKLYYFEQCGRYTAVVGSANITRGGLVDNEELSVVLTGYAGDEGQRQLQRYLGHLPTWLNR